MFSSGIPRFEHMAEIPNDLPLDQGSANFTTGRANSAAPLAKIKHYPERQKLLEALTKYNTSHSAFKKNYIKIIKLNDLLKFENVC